MLGLVYNMFSWITRWNTDETIVEVRAYLDSALVQWAITENESIEHKYTDERRALMEGPVGLGCTVNF